MKKLIIIFLILVKLLFSQEAKADIELKSNDPVCAVAQTFLYDGTSTETTCKYKNNWYYIKIYDVNLENYETKIVNTVIAIDYGITKMHSNKTVDGVIISTAYGTKKIKLDRWRNCFLNGLINPECLF